MIEPPPPRAGEPLRASWAQRLVAYVRSLRVLAGPGLVARRTASGTVVSLAAGAASGTAPRGRSGDVIPCRVRGTNTMAWAEGVACDLYENGYAAGKTGEGVVYLPEVGTRTYPQPGMTFLAHRFVSFRTGGSQEEEGID